MSRITTTVPVSLARRIELEAQARDSTVSALVSEGMEAYLATLKDRGLPSFAGVGDSGRSDVSAHAEDRLRSLVRRRRR